MTSKARDVVSILLLLGLALTLFACIGHWFTPPQLGKLIVGSPVRVGERYEVLISVADMSDGGVAGIRLGTTVEPAVKFTNVDVTSIVAEGLSGFRVTAQRYSYLGGPPAEGSLVAVYGGAAAVSGHVLKLSFEATGVPTVTLDETRIDLVSATPGRIFGWQSDDGVAYYTKEAEGR